MTVRLRGALPPEEMNGLARIEDALTRDPKTKRIVIGVVDVAQRRDHGDGVFEPTTQFLQVELLEGTLRDRGLKILEKAYQSRTGSRALFDYSEEDALAESLPVTQPVVGPRFAFAPAGNGKWWLEYRDEEGFLLARRGGLGVQAELTLGREYTLVDLDALHDDDLSQIARELVEEALNRDVGGDGEGQDEEPLDEADENAREREETETVNA